MNVETVELNLYRDLTQRSSWAPHDIFAIAIFFHFNKRILGVSTRNEDPGHLLFLITRF